MNRFARAAVAAAGTTAIGAGAIGVGAATQPPVPAAPIVLAAGDTDAETAQQDAIARMVAEMTREEDPEGWDRRYGDGT